MEGEFHIRTLNHIFFHNVEKFDHPRLLTFSQDGRTIDFSTRQFRAAVLSLCRHWKTRGFEPGDRIGILAENRPEWHIVDFATLLAGLITVPIYPAFGPAQLRHVLEDSQCSGLVVSGKRQWERISGFRSEIRHLRHVLCLDQWADPPSDVASLIPVIRPQPSSEEDWQKEARDSALSVDPASIATIVYTSGTTGSPKGVVLTHRNIIFDLQQGLGYLQFQTAAQALSVLPLAHVFERLLCYGYFQRGIPIAYGDPYQLAEHLRRWRPEVMGCVPRMLEKIHELALKQIDGLPRWRQRVAHWLLRVGSAHVGEGTLDRRPELGSRLAYPLADLLLFRRVRNRLGGRLRGLICGGAKLRYNVEEFFFAARIPVLQGYGLTETSPVITLNPFGRSKLGTVGKPLPGVELRISSDGEILTRGPNVMAGYYRDPEQSAHALRDGWLLTGDLGKLDEDGYLSITGRKKEILVTSGGKNVSPAYIEEALRNSPLIRQAFVVGDGRKFISALIVPEWETLRSLARSGKIPAGDDKELLQSNPVIDLYWQEIQSCQQGFSDYEKVKKFCFLDASALEDPELITPTQKLRRQALEAKYRPQIDRMYTAVSRHEIRNHGLS